MIKVCRSRGFTLNRFARPLTFFQPEPLVGDENLWRIPSGGLKLMARPLFSQSAMDPKSATHAETSTHVDPYSNVNTLHQVNPQGFLAPMINPAFVNSTDTREPGVHGVGTTSGQPGVAQFFTQGLTNGPVPVGHPMNATVPMGGFGLLDFGPMIPFHGSSTLPEGVDMKFGDSPTRGGMHISFGLPRRTKTGRRAPVRSPPRTEEANLGILCARLLKEGADVEAVDFVRVIFAGAVTEEALRAPINTYEKWCEYSGATRVYQLLLKMKMEMSGETSYCCRLCPEMRRPEYKYERDAVRHLKRDHFGFAVACIYW